MIGRCKYKTHHLL